MDLSLCFDLSVLCCIMFMFLQSSDAVARFTKVPNDTLYVVKGQTARFTWDYHVDDIKKEFDSGSPRWYFQGNPFVQWIGYGQPFDGRKFTIDTNRCPRRLWTPTVRVRVEDNATLVVTNVTLADSGPYGCVLFLSKGRSMPQSEVKLIVTEPPVSPALTIVKVSPTTVTLRWSRPKENTSKIEYYTIYMKAAGVNTWSQAGTLEGELFIYTIKDLIPGKTYRFLVTAARNKEGSSILDENAKTVTLPLLPIVTTTPPPTSSSGPSRSGSKLDPNEDEDCALKVGVLAAFLAFSILVIILLVVFIVWKHRRMHKIQQNENAVYYNVNTHGMASSSSAADQQVPNSPMSAAPLVIVNTSNATVQNEPRLNAGMENSNKEYYQQLNPDTMQNHGAVVQTYEQLRNRDVDTGESNNQHTYQSLRNHPSDYQSLHTYYNLKTMYTPN